MKTCILVVALLAVVIAVPVAVCGCNAEQIAAANERVTGLQQRVEVLKAQLPGMPEGEEKEDAKLLLARMEKWLADAKAVLADAKDTGDIIERSGEQASKYLPPQFAPWVLLATAVAGGIVREIQSRKPKNALTETVAGIELAKSEMTGGSLTALKEALGDTQSAKTKALVARAKGELK